MKYFIRRTSQKTGKVDYKKNKCVDGFSSLKADCWAFSKQGALKIIEDFKRIYKTANPYWGYVYDIIESNGEGKNE